MLAPLHLASKLRLVGYPVCGRVKNKNTTEPSTRRTLKLAAWNVHTLLDRDDRHECHTAIIAHKLSRYNIDVAALSETRISGSSQFEEVTAGYTFVTASQLVRCDMEGSASLSAPSWQPLSASPHAPFHHAWWGSSSTWKEVMSPPFSAAMRQH